MEEEIPYFILHTRSSSDMTIEVNKYLEEGYIPQGGISVTYDQRAGNNYYQAMVLKSEIT